MLKEIQGWVRFYSERVFVSGRLKHEKPGGRAERMRLITKPVYDEEKFPLVEGMELDRLRIPKGYDALITRFNFSVAPGTAPSRGSVVIVGKRTKLLNLLEKHYSMDILLREITTEAGQVQRLRREIKRLHIVRYQEEKGAKEEAIPADWSVFRIEFEDARWLLRFGGVFGEFNVIQDFDLDGQPIFREHTLKKDGKPWTYRELIERIITSFAFGYQGADQACNRKPIFIGAGVKTTTFSTFGNDLLEVRFNKDAYKVYDQCPWNKRWHGAKRNSVLDELLKEAGLELSVNDAGEIIIAPSLKEKEIIKVIKPQSEDTPRFGWDEGVIPEKLFVVGAPSVRMEKVEPDFEKMQRLFKKIRAEALMNASDLSQGFLDEKLTALEELIEKLMPEFAELESPIEPVVQDLSFRWRNLWGLLAQWDIPAQGFLAYLAHRETVKTLQDAIEHEPETGIDPNRMYPEEQEVAKIYASLGLTVNYRRSKASRLLRDALKCFRVSGDIKVKYTYDSELENIRSLFVPDAPSGKVSLSDSQYKPLRDFLSPIWVKTGKEKRRHRGGTVDLGKMKAQGSIRPKVPMIVWVIDWSKDVDEQLGWWSTVGEQALASSGDWVKTVAAREEIAKGRTPVRIEVPKMLDAKEGVFGFDRRIRFPRIPVLGLSEHAWFVPFLTPIGALIAFESHDERLGILNYFIHEVKRPPSIKGKVVKGLFQFVLIRELREYIRCGERVNREELCKLVDEYAPQIWQAAVKQRSQQITTRVGTLSIEVVPPAGTSVSYRWDGTVGETTVEVNTGRRAGAPMLPLKRRLEVEKAHAKYDLDLFSVDEAIEFADRRGEFAEIPPSVNDRDDEERRLHNAMHTGVIVMYDPNEDEDVIAVQASLRDPRWHIHDLTKLGPLLAREPVGTRADTADYQQPEYVILYGHHWYTPNVDHAGCGHTHKVGGYWYPYVRLPLRFIRPPDTTYSRADSSPYPEVTTVGGHPALKFTTDCADRKVRVYINQINRPKNSDGTPCYFGLLFEYTVDKDEPGSKAVFEFSYTSTKKGDDLTTATTTTKRVYLPTDGGANKLATCALIVFSSGFDPWSVGYVDFRRPGDAADSFTGNVYVLGTKPVYNLNEQEELS